jgi:DNA-binding MarR family transcriptional regulator
MMSRRRTPSSAPAEAAPRGCTSFKLRQLTRRVSQHYDRIVAGAGLKTTQYSLLSQIERLGPVRPSDLAAAMAMDASTLTRNLQPLVASGWAAIGPGADARSRLVIATPAGRAKRAEGQREWKRAQLALNEQLGAARVAALHALLEDCLGALNAVEEDQAHV